MDTEVGWVKAVEEDKVVITLKAGSQCSRCGARMVCAAGSGQPVRELKIPNTLGARVGEKVEITYRESSRIVQAFLLFIVPILFLLTGYVVGRSAFGTEGAAAASAFVGLLVSLGLLRIINNIVEKRQVYIPEMTRIVERRTDQGELH